MDRYGNILLYIFLGGIALTSFFSFSSPSAPVRINDHLIPAVFADALKQGLKVPIFIRYDKSDRTSVSKQKIADAILSLNDGEFQINQIALTDLPERAELAPELKKILEALKDKRLGKGAYLRLSDDAALSLDTKSFYLELTVSEAATSALLLPRTSLLAPASANHVSSILNYTVGSYYNQYHGANNASSYVTLDNTSSWREHHINLNGSVYGVGTSGQRGEFYRAMYERDYQGHRFAAGMVDTWNLQSIASMSALNSSRIYGVTYGNKSSTHIQDNTLSLVPVIVFLPAAGEVHIFRDGKLLSIQNFQMGSYEVDTSRLPFGIYNVDIQIVVNGKTVNSRTAQINKTFARDSSVTGEISWQLFGGVLEYNQKEDYRDRNTDSGNRETWISGLAVSTSRPWLSGVNLKSTLYGFDQNGINESEINIAFSEQVNFNQQTLLATDLTRQSISTFNVNIPGGYGSVWAARNVSHTGEKLSLQRSDSYVMGGAVSLSKVSSQLGLLSVSTINNKYHGNRYINADYSQSLFSNRYVSAAMNTGVQNYFYKNGHKVSEQYINLNISLPLSAWLSTGVSSQNGNVLANLSARKNPEGSVFTQVGGSVSKRIKSSTQNGGASTDDFSASGYASYDTKYNEGTVSVTRSSEKSSNVNLSSQGSIAWTKESVSLGKGSQASGVLLKTDFADDEKIIAKINGRHYPLTGANNYISLPAYAEYNIELMNDKNSESSVDIISGRQNRVVLYPGNIDVIRPEVKQLVTVFGRMKRLDGSNYVNADIASHTGKARTDEQGEFAMDFDKRYPVITLIDHTGERCEADLNLSQARGAMWIGDVKCVPQQRHLHDRVRNL